MATGTWRHCLALPTCELGPLMPAWVLWPPNKLPQAGIQCPTYQHTLEHGLRPASWSAHRRVRASHLTAALQLHGVMDPNGSFCNLKARLPVNSPGTTRLALKPSPVASFPGRSLILPAGHRHQDPQAPGSDPDRTACCEMGQSRELTGCLVSQTCLIHPSPGSAPVGPGMATT